MSSGRSFEAVVLAGGLGTRLKSAVPDLPKPMAPVKGKPFLDWLLRHWIRQGVSRFVLSVGYRYEAIADYFGTSFEGAEIAYSIEREPLGTGGGTLQAVRELKRSEPFLLLNGDTFFEVPLGALAAFHQQNDSELTMSLLEVSANTRYSGVSADSDGRIRAIRGRSSPEDRCLINGGVCLVSAQGFSGLCEFEGRKSSLEDELIAQLLSRGTRVYGFQARGRFLDIGVPEDYRAADQLF